MTAKFLFIIFQYLTVLQKLTVDAFMQTFVSKRKKLMLSQQDVVSEVNDVMVSQVSLSKFERGLLVGGEYDDVKAALTKWMVDHQSDEVTVCF